MRLCALCGTRNPVGGDICAHHVSTDENWAAANRVFCDFLHRRIEPLAVPWTVEELDEAMALMAEN